MTTITQAEYKRMMAGKQAHVAGDHFESMIKTACEWYKEQGIAYIKKSHEPIKILSRPNQFGQFKACFTERSEPDYQGTLRCGQSIVFEAKHTDKNQIAFSRVTQWQQDALEKHHTLGAAAYVFVSLGFFEFYRIPWLVWRDMKEIFGHLHMKQAELKPYQIPTNGGLIMLLDGIEI